jgi:two-component system sensor histidine kinase BaeS
MTETNPVNGTPAAGGADALEAASEAARERQSHVRHELRAPLAVIYPLLTLLRDRGDLTAEQEGYLEVLDRNVIRLETLITATVASGWADCSAAPPTPSVVSLGDVAEEVVAMREAEGAEGAPIRVDVRAAGAPRARADLDDVRQIITDLVRNAAAYTPNDGNVTIRARVEGDARTVTIEVADTGPGVPPEELERVFEFGFRGELARALKVPGLGAGLWVCRELAHRNGGTVEVRSEPGAGLTATLTLPVAEIAPA